MRHQGETVSVTAAQIDIPASVRFLTIGRVRERGAAKTFSISSSKDLVVIGHRMGFPSCVKSVVPRRAG